VLLCLLVLLPFGCSRSAAPRAAPNPGPATAGTHAPPATEAPMPAAKPSGEAVTLAFGGDVHFEGSSRQALSGGLADITPLLSRADLAMVNLETAITTGGSPSGGKQFVFRGRAWMS